MADETEILSKLSAVCAAVFSRPGMVLTADMTAKDVDGWDSLSHITLIVAVEKAFHITLTARDARTMHNLGDFVALIARKLPP